MVILNSRQLNYDTLIYACQFSFIAAVFVGLLGFVTGKIFELADPEKAKKIKYEKMQKKLKKVKEDNDTKNMDNKEEKKAD